MNKKGFTLIELLAVLGLLTIIALLGVPVLLNQIESQKKKNYENFVGDLCLSAEAYINHSNDIEGIESFKEPGDVLSIKMEDLIVNNYVKSNTKNPKTKEKIKATDTIIVTINDNKTYDCNLNGIERKKYKEILLNGTDPILESDMIPVTIANDGTVRKADTTKEWYKYADKKWANAVVLSNPTKYSNKGPGKVIDEDDIKAYYVWIPRYKYKLFNNTTESTIDIVFENKSKSKSSGTEVGQYLTHPAFTFGTEELNGFWVGKFETTGTSASPTIKPYMSGNSNSTITSLRNQKVLEQYNTAGSVSTNSMMMKNDEWGAVAYLFHSKYGIKSKIRINNDNRFHPGCGASSSSSLGGVAACQIEYSKASSYPQSTTGNITGIFDMSGGAWEYMMAVRADSSGKPLSGRHNLYNSGFNGKFGCPTCDSTTSGVDSTKTELTTGTDFPDARYYNLYDNPSNRNNISETNGCNGNACYGHAMNETRKTTGGNGLWYGEYSYFVSTGYPWVARGGGHGDGAGAGVFAFGGNFGHASSAHSFRVVVHHS